jgi:hypothetical protein
VIGQGGNGKTRLGFELLEQLEKREPGVWHAGFLDRDHIEELSNARFQKWRKRRYTLVLLDYAAFFSGKLTQNLMRELARGYHQFPIRVLLLERGAGANQGRYASLKQAAGTNEPTWFADAPKQMTDLTADERVRLFDGAVEAIEGHPARKGSNLCAPALPPDGALRAASITIGCAIRWRSSWRRLWHSKMAI